MSVGHITDSYPSQTLSKPHASVLLFTSVFFYLFLNFRAVRRIAISRFFLIIAKLLFFFQFTTDVAVSRTTFNHVCGSGEILFSPVFIFLPRYYFISSPDSNTHVTYYMLKLQINNNKIIHLLRVK